MKLTIEVELPSPCSLGHLREVVDTLNRIAWEECPFAWEECPTSIRPAQMPVFSYDGRAMAGRLEVSQ